MELLTAIALLKSGLTVAKEAFSLGKKIKKSWQPEDENQKVDIEKLTELLENNVKIQQSQMTVARRLIVLFPFFEKATILRSHYDKIFEIFLSDESEKDDKFWRDQRLSIFSCDKDASEIIEPIENDEFAFKTKEIKVLFKDATRKYKASHTEIKSILLSNIKNDDKYSTQLNIMKDSTLVLEYNIKKEIIDLINSIGFGQE